jgi:tRNA 2-thiouridine synthesizing protein A
MTDNHPITIDARGLACPLPVLKLRKALGAHAPGTVVELLATDRASLKDVPAFCRGNGHDLVETRQADGVLRFTVRKA